jgi:hypothetical protein
MLENKGPSIMKRLGAECMRVIKREGRECKGGMVRKRERGEAFDKVKL